MDEYLYLYGITWAHGSLPGHTSGVDRRFHVEGLPCGRLTAWSSRVGLDQFDPAKLQEGTMDVPWLSEVALRHNEILSELANRSPLLPMKLGTLFHSRDSLLAKVKRHAAWTADFLTALGDRREWAVKVYFDESRLESSLLSADCGAARQTLRGDSAHTLQGQGAHYLAARRRQQERHQRAQVAVKQELSSLEARLQCFTDSWRRLRLLPATLTNRPEKMVWNGAFLLPGPQLRPFQEACEDLEQELTPCGLSLELSGPWPPYHFCPTLES